jgi:hypothetical protein
VQLSDLRPLREKGRTRYGLLDLQVSVLAKVEKKATSTAEAR